MSSRPSSGGTSPSTGAADAAQNPSIRAFVTRAAEHLQGRLEVTPGGLHLTLPETAASAEGAAAAAVDEVLIDDSAGDDEQPDAATPARRSLGWLSRQLARLGPALHREPLRQPQSVHEIAAGLLPAYQIDAGQVHLGGCLLEDRAFLRLTLAPTEPGGELETVYVAPDGSSVSPAMIAALQLEATRPITSVPPRIEASELAAFESAGRRMIAQRRAGRDPGAVSGEPLARELIWAKYVTGKLEFTAGDEVVEHPFAGWAALLEPTPVHCHASGRETFHLAPLDDGRIVASEAIARCARSGRRVLDSELVTCAVTAERVLEEFTVRCPVLGKPVLSDQFVTCPRCHQQVSRAALVEQGCGGCQQVRPVAPDDPRVVWLVDEHQGLEKWSHWKIAETETVYIVEASRWLRRLLIVFDRESLAIRYLAMAGRFSRALQPVPPEEWAARLK